MSREASSLTNLRLFDQVVLVGTTDGKLPRKEEIQSGLYIRRLGAPRKPSGIVRKILSSLEWSRAVFKAYRREPLACINCHSVSVLPIVHNPETCDRGSSGL